MRKATVFYTIVNPEATCNTFRRGISESRFKRNYKEVFKIDVSLDSSDVRICEKLYKDINSRRLRVKADRGIGIGDIIRVGRDYYLCHNLGFTKVKVG